MKYQFNKTAIQRLNRELNVRVRALPTLKAKETALRVEVKKASDALKSLEHELLKLKLAGQEYAELWREFPDILKLKDAQIIYRNIAGVRIPVLKDLEFERRDHSLFINRAWVPGGAEVLKEFCILTLQIQLTQDSFEILHRARKKTTQKVNLYEKVQIPEYQEAIRKIKSFLEDQENLSRAAQKMVKERHARQEQEASKI